MATKKKFKLKSKWYKPQPISCKSTKMELEAFRKREAAFKAGNPPTLGQRQRQELEDCLNEVE